MPNDEQEFKEAIEAILPTEIPESIAFDIGYNTAIRSTRTNLHNYIEGVFNAERQS